MRVETGTLRTCFVSNFARLKGAILIQIESSNFINDKSKSGDHKNLLPFRACFAPLGGSAALTPPHFPRNFMQITIETMLKAQMRINSITKITIGIVADFGVDFGLQVPRINYRSHLEPG